MMRFGTHLGVAVLFVAAASLVGCAGARKSGVYAAMPFAVIGDSAMLPFQGLGRASSCLFALGDEHLDYVRETNKGKVTVPLAEFAAGVYYVPACALWPFDVATSTTLYPMTKACVAVATAGSLGTNTPSRASSAPQTRFKEW